MGTHSRPVPRIHFGPFEYDVASGELWKFGARVRLPRQPAGILSMLAARPGQLVTREELKNQLWQGATFGDFDQGLNAAMNKLRQSLGDSADQPRYIETVPGQGYRFVAPVEKPPAMSVLEMSSRVLLKAGAPRPPRWPWPAIAVAALVAAAGMALYWAAGAARPPALPKTVRFTVEPPPGYELEASASRQSFALSPDGNALAFAAMDSSGAFSLFVRELNSLEPRMIPDTAGAHTMFWAPDSRTLFLALRGTLRRVSLDGEAPVNFGSTPPFLSSGAWLSANRLLLVGGAATLAMSAPDGSSQPLAKKIRWPQLLPDGRLLFTSWDAQAERWRARVVRTEDLNRSQDLIESDSRVMYTESALRPGTGYLVYVRSGNLVACPFDPRALKVTGEAVGVAANITSFFKTGAADFSVSGRGTIAYQSHVRRSQLAWVDRRGRKSSALGAPNLSVKSGRISPDGRLVATALYDVERGAQDLWIFDAATGEGRRMSPEPGLRDAPVWSPDSAKLAFLFGGKGDGPPGIHLRGIGVKDLEEIIPPGGFQLPTDWSPDGRFVMYSNSGFSRFPSEAHGDVWVADLARERKLIPILATRFHEGNGTFSPDGKWVAFTSNESGRPEIYLQAFESSDSPGVTGARYPVTRSGAVALRWRRDGKELFFLGFDGRVWAIPVTLSPAPRFGRAEALFTISTEARAAIHSIIGFDVSADGQRFLIPIVTTAERPKLVVVQNWESSLSAAR